MPESATTKRALIEERLRQLDEPQTLDSIVLGRRTHGQGWGSISSHVTELTSVDITGESLRQWFPKYNRPGIELAELANTS